MNKGGGIYLLIGLLLLFLILDVGLATWLLTPPLTRRYVVQPGETLADIADKYKVHEQVILQNNDLRPGNLVQPGQVLFVPMAPLVPFLEWKLQLVGLAGTLIGVLIGFWLSSLSGLLPKGFSGRVFGTSLAVAVISYVMIQTSSNAVSVTVTPLFVLSSIRDGFAWSTSVPLLARALGFAPSQTLSG